MSETKKYQKLLLQVQLSEQISVIEKSNEMIIDKFATRMDKKIELLQEK